ncbi:alpha-ketoglutarate-dependent dioxygenase AlkB family protein [Pseudomonas oryzihabitans]|uniref:alpha-ketoglutarate-dependent dioxygenase AlkB family protein n=1 Tax=Pseudomonas oryzihabitans TaxID=47885 RepID=UPI00119D0274|nr:alpha-ketoglutarate-dependent dioxygenase AlkB [Pseudomonas psychrotolerans]
MVEELTLADAELAFYPQWRSPDQADAWLRELDAETPWSQPQVRVFNRWHPVPRQVAWYADPGVVYGYAGLDHAALPWTPLLQLIREEVEAACGQAFNGVLLNRYRDGQDSMGWHSDDETSLGRNPLIASLNLGATRRFDFRRKGTSRIGHSLPLGHGSLLVMAGATQHHWQHQIAKTRKASGVRLNLTFRWIAP